MPGRSVCYMKKLILSLLILSGLTVSLLSQDKQISGIINIYRHVVAIGPGLDNVTLNRVDSIAPGDTVLLIQMQGVGIDTTQGSYGIAVQSKYGEPGGSEFLLVQSVDAGSNKVVFRNNILNTFDIKGSVQLVRVPYYNSATVTGKLTSKAWDNIDKTGGVLAMILGRKLKLNADIDVSGKGFLGGKDALGNAECVMINPIGNNHDSYPETWLNAGYKGEGLAIHDMYTNLLAPLHVKGKGISFTGGGGGNGKFSGGGGGSNRGKGGDGLYEKNLLAGLCADPQPGAYGGTTVKATVIQNGVFFGGGGGASTHSSGSAGSSGGNGGGIVIIIADTISGNGKFIKADGATAGNAISDGGAGGGGAGGSVVFSLQSFSKVATDSLKISVKGGNGGTNPGGFGAGGGGGGGLFWVSTDAIANKVQTNLNYGIPGPASLLEGKGEIKYGFSPKLNGFLFNSIRSEITGNLVDSVCTNLIPPKITGTKPVGGKSPYFYTWEKSYDKDFVTKILLVNDTDPVNYTPTVSEASNVIDTVWFRRTITDSSVPLVDISKPVMIIIQPAITGNLVGKDTTICYNQNPLNLIPLNAGPAKGIGIYGYKWIKNLTDTDWTTSPDASGIITNNDYDPPVLTNTTYFKRVVTSGRCVDYSPTVKITVLPLITGNIMVRSDSVICEGSLFNKIDVSAPSGGDQTYKYLWQESTASVSWISATGINDGLTYSVDTSKYSVLERRYFRRIVYSGPDTVCRNNSSPIQFIRYHKIKNNSILADQTICSGSSPVALQGSTPLQGSGAYTYLWQDSSKVSTWTTKGSTDFSFLPAALTDTTWYRRIVNSSKCNNTSLSIRVNVHKPIINNNISLLASGLADTTICSNAVPNLLKGTAATGGTNIPGDFAYQWFFSTDSIKWNPVTVAGTGVTYRPGSLTETTYFKRQVISGTCTVISSRKITVKVLPLIISNNISTSHSVCYNTTPNQLTGTTPTGGTGTYSFLWEQSSDGTTWKPATGTNNSTSGNYQPPVLTVPMKYKRIAKSGANDCCTSFSNIIDIGIYPLPASPVNAGPDTTLFSFDYIIHMVANPLVAGETGLWTLISGTGDFDNNSNNFAEVRNLSKGNNTFLWTVTKGICKLYDTINIDVYDLVVPEGFSPNNDPGNFNNEFIISGLDLPNQIAELKIINGAGAEVFSTTNQDGREWTDWDGKNSRGIDFPEGTYYYLLKLTSKGNGQIFKKSGFVVLKRY